MPRIFTPEEANALLPQVRPLAEELVARAAAFDEAAAVHTRLVTRIAGNGGDMPPSELAEATAAAEEAEGLVRETLGQLRLLGVEVKDPRTGLLDFPAERDGEAVLLCWRVGEPEVAWWHGEDEGFAGRKPLPF